MMNTMIAFLQKMVDEINQKSHHHSELKNPDENGIRWAWFGHNSSHEFYLGVDGNDRLWRKSYSDTEDESSMALVAGTFSTPELVDISRLGSPYMGHW